MRDSIARLVLYAMMAGTSFGAGEMSEDEVLVVMIREGEAESATLAQLIQRKDFDEAWVWSSRFPPTRVALSDDVAEVISRARSTARELRLRVDGLSSREKNEGIIYAAPLEMWERVPEDLIPGFPVRDRSAVVPAGSATTTRSRFVGPTKGSWWTDARPMDATLRLAAFAAREMTVRIDAGASPRTRMELARKPGVDLNPTWARYVSRAGVISIPRLPDREPLSWIARAEGFAPAAGVSLPSQIPAKIHVAPGHSVSGRFVDGEGEPLAGVSVIIDGWITDEVPQRIAAETKSGEDGRWRIGQLPDRPVLLTARKSELVTLRMPLKLRGDETDLGDLELRPGERLEVLVMNSNGEPIEAAKVTLGGGAGIITDVHGRATFLTADRAARAKLVVIHEDYLTEIRNIDPPLPERIELAIQAPLRVQGRFVDEIGEPVLNPSLQLRIASEESAKEIRVDGRFSIGIAPDSSAEIVLSGSNVRATRLAVEPGSEGERRNLGDIRAERGGVIRGRVASRANGGPLPGVRAWSPQPAPQGAILSWVRGDVVQATSDSSGELELGGLPFGQTRVRFDAPGFARTIRDFDIDPAEPTVDVGTIWMSEGATIEVTTEEGRGTAVVDVGGEWEEMDMLRAPLVDGRATVRNVPAGESVLMVTEGEQIICEKTLSIPEQPEILTVECDQRRPRVTGEVIMGGRPVLGGMVTWSRDGRESDAVIVSRFAVGGVRQQQAMGGGPGAISITLRDDGTFETDRLLPGNWSARWMGGEGVSAPPVRVEIPDAETHFVRLDLQGGMLSGQVVDADQVGVRAARVIDLDSHSLALTAADGSFTLTGLPPGNRRIQARTVELASSVAAVEIQPGEQPTPVILTLNDALREKLELVVTSRSGQRVSGAFVIVETSTGEGRLLSTNSSGAATALFPAGLTGSVRLAASYSGAWTFGSWIAVRDLDGPIVARFGEVGSIAIRGAEELENVEIIGPNGWNVSLLHRRLGVLLQASRETPLRVTGLPPAGYTVRRGSGMPRALQVESGRETVLDLAD